jgi:hypothetical protein
MLTAPGLLGAACVIVRRKPCLCRTKAASVGGLFHPRMSLIRLILPLCGRVTLNQGASMSERSVYLLDQADKCQWQARRIMDDETQAQLLKMAAEYIKRAAEIESRD